MTLVFKIISVVEDDNDDISVSAIRQIHKVACEGNEKLRHRIQGFLRDLREWFAAHLRIRR